MSCVYTPHMVVYSRAFAGQQVGAKRGTCPSIGPINRAKRFIGGGGIPYEQGGGFLYANLCLFGALFFIRGLFFWVAFSKTV